MVVSSHTRSSMGYITTTEGRREPLFSADGESSQYGFGKTQLPQESVYHPDDVPSVAVLAHASPPSRAGPGANPRHPAADSALVRSRMPRSESPCAVEATSLMRIKALDYISIPCAPAPPSSLSLGFSATIASVVSIKDATLDAFCSAKRVTLVGSITPALSRSSYWPLSALKPNAPAPSRTLLTTMEPSQPPLATIQRSGSSSARRTMSTPNFSPPLTSSFSSAGRQRR